MLNPRPLMHLQHESQALKRQNKDAWWDVCWLFHSYIPKRLYCIDIDKLHIHICLNLLSFFDYWKLMFLNYLWARNQMVINFIIFLKQRFILCGCSDQLWWHGVMPLHSELKFSLKSIIRLTLEGPNCTLKIKVWLQHVLEQSPLPGTRCGIHKPC